MQSRLGSLLETLISTLIGLIVSTTANLWFLPLWGFEVTVGDAIGISILFTIISIARGYGVRRLFNWIGAHNG